MTQSNSKIVNILADLKSWVDRINSEFDVTSLPPTDAELAHAESCANGRPLRRSCYGDLASKLYVERRVREKIFGNPNLFGEPVWDILLDLMIAKERGHKLTVSAVCIGASCPETTALRYIDVLIKRQLAYKLQDSKDSRRKYVVITDKAHQLMVEFLDTTFDLSTQDVKSYSSIAPEWHLKNYEAKGRKFG